MFSNIIINVNDSMTSINAAQMLNIANNKVRVFICPDRSLEDIASWKAAVCQAEDTALMLDHDSEVIRACHKAGINGILVRQSFWEFETT